MDNRVTLAWLDRLGTSLASRPTLPYRQPQYAWYAFTNDGLSCFLLQNHITLTLDKQEDHAL